MFTWACGERRYPHTPNLFRRGQQIRSGEWHGESDDCWVTWLQTLRISNVQRKTCSPAQKDKVSEKWTSLETIPWLEVARNFYFQTMTISIYLQHRRTWNSYQVAELYPVWNIWVISKSLVPCLRTHWWICFSGTLWTPLVFACLPNKTKTTYKKLFQKLTVIILFKWKTRSIISLSFHRS